MRGKEAVELGCVQQLLIVMERHNSNAAVMEQACHAAVRICRTGCGAASTQRAAAVGLIEAVVRAVRTHRGSAGVTKQACGLIANLCDREVASAAANEKRAMEAGAIDALLGALRQQQARVDVCSEALRAMRHLTSKKENAGVAVQAGAVEAVACHIWSADAVSDCLAVMFHFLGNDDIKDDVLRRARSACSEALRRDLRAKHGNNGDVKRFLGYV